jgi:hypothetical protein
MIYTQLINFENGEWHVAQAKNLEKESSSKLISSLSDMTRRKNLQSIERENEKSQGLTKNI